jgi:hypothetical protein
MSCNLNIDAGGIFSKYMYGIQNGILHECDSYYFNVIDVRTNSNIFDTVLEQTYEPSHQHITCDNLGNYSKLNSIENSNNFINYVNFIEKLKFNDKLLEKVDYYTKKMNIDDSTVGVHIRLTDMNIIHGNDYGTLSFDNFVAQLNPDTKYFISSDNNESIVKLKDLYGDNISYIDGLIRCERENDASDLLQLNNFKNPQLWFEGFLEMLLLSKCGTLICRTSNLSNATIIHSKTIKNIIRL